MAKKLIHQSSLATTQFHQSENIRIRICFNKSALDAKLFGQFSETIKIDVTVQHGHFFVFEIDNRFNV